MRPVRAAAQLGVGLVLCLTTAVSGSRHHLRDHFRPAAAHAQAGPYAASIAVVTVAISDSPSHRPAEEALLENKRQYCARHGYDILTADQEYPLFDHADTFLTEPDRRILERTLGKKVPWLPCPWNIPLTLIAASRILLDHHYDWVLYQQLDTVFINMDISLASIAARAPADAHIILTANMGFIINDVSLMVRNSAQGKRMLDSIITLQRRMRACPAPGMAVINTYFLHRLNGTVVDGAPVYYHGQCEQACGASLKSFDDMWQFHDYFVCLTPWFKKFNIDGWHVRAVTIPGFWIQPGATPVVLESGLPVMGDDIVAFGHEAMLNDGYNGEPWNDPTSFMYRARPAAELAFCRRFPTTLSFHTGGSTRGPKAALLVADVARLYNSCNYTQHTLPITDTLDHVAVHPGWSAKMTLFDSVECQYEYLDDGTLLSQAQHDDFGDGSRRGCRYIRRRLGV